MEYGIDRRGNIISHTKAISGNTYLCPSCNEQVIKVRGEKACFKHKIKRNRTPLERSCPEYHEQKSWRIQEASDVIYISNGGIPLYLCNIEKEFELRAYFPSVRDICIKKFNEDRVKIIIDEDAIYNASEISYYTVDTIKDWIHVRAEPNIPYKEIQRRWLWGIKGIDINKDLYYGYEDGGYRLAVNAKVYIKKIYRWITEKSIIPVVKGISFNKVGEIWLKQGMTSRCYFVQELQVTSFTEDARQFIESRGYHLCENVKHIVPLWPPVAKKGNELSVDSNKMFFFYPSKTNREAIYQIQNGNVKEVIGEDLYKIEGLSLMSEITLLITNTINLDIANQRNVSEIKYLLMHKEDLCNIQCLEPQVCIEDIGGKIVERGLDKIDLPLEGKVFIKGNVPITGQVFKNGYCIYSGTNILEKIEYDTEIVINAKGFGIFKYSWKRNKVVKSDTIDLDWNELYRKLYSCTGSVMKPTYKNKLLLNYLSKQKNNKEALYVYRLVYSWFQRKEIPVSAQIYLEETFYKELK